MFVLYMWARVRHTQTHTDTLNSLNKTVFLHINIILYFYVDYSSLFLFHLDKYLNPFIVVIKAAQIQSTNIARMKTDIYEKMEKGKNFKFLIIFILKKFVLDSYFYLTLCIWIQLRHWLPFHSNCLLFYFRQQQKNTKKNHFWCASSSK